ncbi:hypothetical protein TCAL_11276 [Tigriopus californicus]|uniref:PID domain-containing protein n=1 Tax=Tigriopus californicus TaxID=6832 RepID=A0A553NST6_TIGCA|nr:uncharacterized protein LOC131881871 [Tigriopus californicus]TRY68502.1 hypothetical protein TCAL_11276 [Tigriopus californicus]|eukprot:TCALIF_11276-PA protein Name:"Protein of unknown function" AED:0.00 eAED:0.00 QI:680/1/1/1/1/1/2/112/268
MSVSKKGSSVAPDNSSETHFSSTGLVKENMPILTDNPKTTSVPVTQHLSKLKVHKSSKSGNKAKNVPSLNPPEDVSSEPTNPGDVTLPQTFAVKGLGKRSTGGLWGIKNTRKPVDDMVMEARAGRSKPSLPFLLMHVSDEGVRIEGLAQNKNVNFEEGPFPIDCISYGVQDLVYTRVFAMIVVKEQSSDSIPSRGTIATTSDRHQPFECYGYVCDSRLNARRLTFALAKAFQEFSKTAKSKEKRGQFAIDLRTPEQMEIDLQEEETEA